MAYNTTTTMHIKTLSRSSAFLDWIQMITGILMLLFMWSHLVLVGSILFGSEAMNTLAKFFEDTMMFQIGGPIVFAGFLLHFIIAVRKIPFRYEHGKIFVKHSSMMHHADTWFWLVQVITAMIILILASIHMWVVLTTGEITAEISKNRVQTPFWTGLYILLLFSVELHLGVGFYRVLVKWGVIKRRTRKLAKVIEWGLTTIFISLGIAILVKFWMMSQ
jgi:fumarate reductase subunit C